MPADRNRVIELWRACDLVRPWNDPNKDIDRKLAHSPEDVLVAEHEGQIVGAVMDAAETHLLELGCPKINLQIRTTNDAVMTFYDRLGYSRDDCVSMGKRLIPDS